MRLNKTSRLDPFEHRLRRRLEREGEALAAAGERRAILVACSGGRDSMALLSALAAAAPLAHFALAVGHAHHGASRDPSLVAARDRARLLVRDEATRLSLPYFEALPEETAALASGEELRSEAALRDFRRNLLARLVGRAGAALVALAHHQDDLFETRLIRLLRGTGADGLQAMRSRRGIWFRPLLDESRTEIEAYAVAHGLKWLEDPSNADPGPLRNWLRLRWLPELEAKRPGAGRAMARSLAALAEAHAATANNNAFAVAANASATAAIDSTKVGTAALAPVDIARSLFAQADARGQERLVAVAMREAGAPEMTSGRVAEVRKRLQSRQKTFRFSVGGVEWTINAERIRAKLKPRIG